MYWGNEKMDFSLFQMIAKEAQKQGLLNCFVSFLDDEPRYISKVKQGIVLYEPRVRPMTFKSMADKIILHRQICSLRITQKSCLR